MKHHSVCRFIPVVFAALWMASSSVAADGVIIKVDGDVSVQSGGKTTPAAVGHKVVKGDVVKSGGGTATLLLSNGQVRAIAANQSFTMAMEDSADDSSMKRLIMSLTETVNSGKGPMITASVRGAGSIKSVFPFNSFIAPDELKFQWESVKGLADLDLSITAAKPEYRYSFKVKSNENKVGLPKEAPAFLPDTRYYWQVKELERVEGEPYSSRICWFALMPKEKLAQVEAEARNIEALKDVDAHGRSLLLAGLYIAYGLNNKALALLEKELEANPNDEGTAALLTGLYVQMNNPDAVSKPK